jgi:hypothetical protein
VSQGDVVTPQEIIDRTAPIIGSVGSSYYFHPDTLAAGKEAGLDGFRFYFLGRGGVLGDVEPAVVTSAFGYFHPALVENIWTSAKAVVAPREAARLYLGCCAHVGRTVLTDVAGLEGFCAAAEKIVARTHPAGLALFAGIAAEPLPEDLPARALHLVAVIRELRGSVHLVAIVASGVTPAVAHAIRRPDMVKAFGWEDVAIDDAARDRLATADSLTDQMQLPVYALLSDEEATAFVAGAEAIAAAFDAGR